MLLDEFDDVIEPGGELQRVLDAELQPVAIPPAGIVVVNG